ncbi:MAG: response regulator [Verrucomicrobiota bacterium]
MSFASHWEGSKGTPLIFVVDTDSVVRQAVASVLNWSGCRTRVFRDSKEVLDELASGETTPDLLVTGYSFPGISGLKLIARCRARWPGMKTVLISRRFWPGAVVAAFHKADKFMHKPFDVKVFVDAVHELLHPAPVKEF